MTYLPVCGSNNRTYHNYCVLRCVRITMNKTLEMAHRWKCGTPLSEQRELDMALKQMPATESIPEAGPELLNDTDVHWESYAQLEQQ
uniref:Kazal-like domain-containing protein n=1 Tax=Anopheles minimus TaxID=112268 RepID=A0A182VUL3_9DIPT